MRYLVICFLACTLFAFRCEKDDDDKVCSTELSITQTTAPLSGTTGVDLRIPVTCTGPNLCYSFESLQITNPSPRRYIVRAKGLAPCGPAVCPQAIYSADTAVHIIPPVAGQYIIEYHLFDARTSADTIQVN